MTAWRQSRPLAGKSVLDATPVFRNTLCKYLALLAGGAQLSVYAHPDIPCDQEGGVVVLTQDVEQVIEEAALVVDERPVVERAAQVQVRGVEEQHIGLC